MSVEVFNDDYFMRQALYEAEQGAEEGEVPVGAIIVSNNKIIAKAHNQVEKLQDVTAHAEMIAITSAQNHLNSKYLSECKMYVTLEPCTMCAGALFWSQIGAIIIAAKDEKRGFSVRTEPILHPKTEVKWGILKLEAEVQIKDFFKGIRGNN